MIKLLLLAAVVWLIYSILKNYARSVDRDETDVPATPEQEDMVRCAQCGVHLPKSESILSRGEFYCSEEHRRQHQGNS
ncbi:PP0621 family protein [Sulfurimicrobium lacus]|uniref:PP0621 family protein n=1 Tax=Sulfurimicrobium lacus TaxID=2715678 RepID=UPI001566AD85|nr:PP0621 family protein [Sulfurimicrobium lacus]